MVERFVRVRYRAIVVLLTCALGLLYVGYQSVQGERGLLGWVERSAEVEKTRAEVAVLADERAKLERRVSQLRTDNLDLDLLDQEARRLLNLGRPDEEVLFHDAPAQSRPGEGE
ncbi:MAG: septum formation initiator family protein [Chloroflexota bacterium]|nr:septum formation initiator family protein [Rhodospirillales bacterium]MDE2892480.1 septum formation initiator family protein [Chloroflexota bacterium]